MPVCRIVRQRVSLPIRSGDPAKQELGVLSCPGGLPGFSPDRYDRYVHAATWGKYTLRSQWLNHMDCALILSRLTQYRETRGETNEDLDFIIRVFERACDGGVGTGIEGSVTDG